jgi:nucleotide-binding universal stress UspA family protein
MNRLIVVALDGASEGERALATAVSIARKLDASMHLVRVASAAPSTTGPWLMGRQFRAEMAAHVRGTVERETAYLDGVASRVAAQLEAGKVATALLEGPSAQAIVSYARKQDAELIVMASHGRTALRRGRPGSVTDRVARWAGLPVLVPPPDEQSANDSIGEWECRRILIPLDGSPSAEQVVQHAASLARPFAARVTLLRVLDPGTELDVGYSSMPLGVLLDLVDPASQAAAERNMARVAEALRRDGLHVDARIIRSIRPAQAIAHVARELGVDLIAMATRGRGSALRFAFGSVAHGVLRQSPVPTLILRPRDRGHAQRSHSASITASGTPAAPALSGQ